MLKPYDKRRADETATEKPPSHPRKERKTRLSSQSAMLAFAMTQAVFSHSSRCRCKLDQFNPLALSKVAAILLLRRIIPMFMDTQICNHVPLAVRINRSRGGLRHQSRFVKIVFYCGIIPQGTVAAGDRRLVHQKVRSYTVNGNRVLGDKHAGGIVTVERCLLPAGVLPGDGCPLRPIGT